MSAVIQECQPCQKDVFTCYGGDKIIANAGYQRVLKSNDVFAKCDKLGGEDVCANNNTCIDGYEGFMCKKCSDGFYKEFDGSCQECDLGYKEFLYSILMIVFFATIPLLLAVFLTNCLKSAQDKNKASSVFYLFKNLLNYVILTALLSQIFANTWFKPIVIDEE